jgi:muramoyltetrapeptide carboxypeptidase
MSIDQRIKQQIRKPPALGPGSRIGLVAPSSPFDEEALKAGTGFLEAQGFRVCHLPGLSRRRRGFLAGEDEQRADELMHMFEDPRVDAVFVVRGGYGAQRIVDRLDPERIARNPKIFLGYSDVTILLSFLVDRCGLVCFHGPLVTEMGSLSPLTRNSLLQTLTDPKPAGSLPMGEERWIREGEAAGPLAGGNLSILCSALGTPWETRTEGRILFLEDSGEKPYRIDRMLVQMKQAGKLGSVAGIVFGRFRTARGASPSERDREAVFQVHCEHTRDLGVPVLSGLPAGHGRENVTLPMGCRAGIGFGGEAFSLLEPAVTPRGQER